MEKDIERNASIEGGVYENHHRLFQNRGLGLMHGYGATSVFLDLFSLWESPPTFATLGWISLNDFIYLWLSLLKSEVPEESVLDCNGEDNDQVSC